MDSTPARTPAAYRHLESVSAALLLFMTVWAPWAFGCTTYESIQVLNYAGYTLGALLLAKWIVRGRTGFPPPRWTEPTPVGRWLIGLLAALTVLLLAYVLAGVVNARAAAEHTKAGVQFTYFDGPQLTWLPSSYDASRSLPVFRNWLAVALTFWAARDWLLGKSRHERHLKTDAPGRFPPKRLRVLLWTWVLSSSALALACILQRLDGTDKLLWLLKPIGTGQPDFHFGPYTYRTNAAQYFNLVWPVALGFWWSLRAAYREQHGFQSRLGGGAHVMLLPCALLLAACPIVSTSRGGALIMGTLTLGALVVLLSARSAGSWVGRSALGGLFAAVFAFAWLLGGKSLSDRFIAHAMDPLNGRTEVYETAYRMLPDFTWLGSGAGTFISIYPLYRLNPESVWAAYAHNDWLEARITLGRIGLSMLVLMLLAIPLIVRNSCGTGIHREFAALTMLALGGMLVHAVFDFPFLIHSLLYQFCVLLAIVSTLGRRPV